MAAFQSLRKNSLDSPNLTLAVSWCCLCEMYFLCFEVPPLCWPPFATKMPCCILGNGKFTKQGILLHIECKNILSQFWASSYYALKWSHCLGHPINIKTSPSPYPFLIQWITCRILVCTCSLPVAVCIAASSSFPFCIQWFTFVIFQFLLF